eukprot:Gb_02675 [translate_table: standard]
MDTEFWSVGVKRQQAVEAPHSYTDRYMSLEDLEEEDETREEFTCPLCEKDFDIVTLCHHFDDEHCYETHNVVCPVCAAKVGKDVHWPGTLEEFVGYHVKMCPFVCPLITRHIQRRRRLRKAGMPSNSTLSILGKELREGRLQSLLGGASSRAGANSFSAAPDPLISSFVYNLPIYEPEDQPQSSLCTEESLTKNSTSSPQVINRYVD